MFRATREESSSEDLVWSQGAGKWSENESHHLPGATSLGRSGSLKHMSLLQLG